ncbi:MAG: long-chain fatty acid--CoA ligase, partial [Acidobacteria bacterium]|nr:long-chain fatty acid--CoA ligase [Acidobacteriota bacterium]
MNVADSFSRAVLHYAEKTALIFENESYTYGQMNSLIDNLVIYLARSG